MTQTSQFSLDLSWQGTWAGSSDWFRGEWKTDGWDRLESIYNNRAYWLCTWTGTQRPLQAPNSSSPLTCYKRSVGFIYYQSSNSSFRIFNYCSRWFIPQWDEYAFISSSLTGALLLWGTGLRHAIGATGATGASRRLWSHSHSHSEVAVLEQWYKIQINPLIII